MKNKKLIKNIKKLNNFNKRIDEFYIEINLIKEKYKIEKMVVLSEFGVFSDLNNLDLMDLTFKAIEIPIVKLIQDKMLNIEDIPNFYQKLGFYFQENYYKTLN